MYIGFILVNKQWTPQFETDEKGLVEVWIDDRINKGGEFVVVRRRLGSVEVVRAWSNEPR